MPRLVSNDTCKSEVHTLQITEKLALDVGEAAELLGISKPTMYEVCNRADFKAMFKIGKRTKISREGLVDWVRRQAGGEATGYAGQ